MNKIIEIGKSVGIFCLYLLLPIFLATIIAGRFTNNGATVLISVQIITIIIFIIIFRKVLVTDYKDFKTNSKNYMRYAFKLWFFGLMAMMFFNLIINFVINPGAIAVNEELNREQLNSQILISLVAILIYAPLIEELAFRANLRKFFKKAFHFALFSGFLFAFLHISTSFLFARQELIIPIDEQIAPLHINDREIRAYITIDKQDVRVSALSTETNEGTILISEQEITVLIDEQEITFLFEEQKATFRTNDEDDLIIINKQELTTEVDGYEISITVDQQGSGIDTGESESVPFDWKQLLYIFPYGALGFAFGYIYRKTNNIYSTIFIHFWHNFLTVGLLLLASLLA